MPGTFGGRGHHVHRQRKSTRDGPARSFQPPDIPEGGSSIVESLEGAPGTLNAEGVPQLVACEVHDRTRAGQRSAAPGGAGNNNNFSDSLSQAAESELQSIGIGVDSPGQTPAQIPVVMRSSAFSPYHTGVIQDPSVIRPYHTTFIPATGQSIDPQLLRPIPQHAADYGVNPIFLSGMATPQHIGYPSAAVQLPVQFQTLYSEIPQDPRGARLMARQMQNSMHASMHGGPSRGPGQIGTPGPQAATPAVALPLHVVPVMAAAAAHNMQQLQSGQMAANDSLQQSQLYAYCFEQPNQLAVQPQTQMEAIATSPAVAQLRSEASTLRSATASPTRSLPPRERVYAGIVKGSRV